LLDKLRGALLELDRTTSAIGAPLAKTLDLADRLGASEQRAREHAKALQTLLAGDVIFVDARDQLDAIRLQVAAARGQLGQTIDARYAAVRRRQAMMAIGAAAIAALALIVLVPPIAASASPTTASTVSPVAANPEEYARLVPTPRPAATTSPPAAKPATAPAARPAAVAAAPAAPRSAARPGVRDGIVSAEVMAARSAAGLEPTYRPSEAATVRGAPAPVERPVPPAPSVSPDGWRDAATLCTDIARVSDSHEVSALLARAASLLNASGIVLWMTANGDGELAPAASTGYDERLVARLGKISRDADNVTAAAYRDAAPKTSAARGDASAALAIPLLTPGGPVGVLSAEIREASDVDAQRQALATILAAQLSMLLGAATYTAGASQASGAGEAGEVSRAGG
jgi:hypothetical protein